MKNEAFKNKTYRYYNANVKNRRFKMEDLVLRKLEAICYFGRKKKGKTTLKWDGLYTVTRVIKTNTNHLQDMKRKKKSPSHIAFKSLRKVFVVNIFCTSL
jgi:hypothetical protein